MTYGLSLLCREGIAFLSDSRSSAGVDNITVHSKMRVFANEGDRVLCVLSSGNLSVTQSVMELIDTALARRAAEGAGESILTGASLYETVRYVGELVRTVRHLDGKWLEAANHSFNVNFILGGQIGAQPPQIYQIYAEGNAIHASVGSPFLQVGELKYGKPILDRGFTYETPLAEAVRFGILSLDATAKSNLSVGTPFEVFCYEAGSLRAEKRAVLDDDDAWLSVIRERWQRGLVSLVRDMPELDFSSR